MQQVQNNLVAFIIAIKLSGLSLPAYIGLSILNSQKGKWLYIGESHAYFHEKARYLGLKGQWSYGAVGRILNVLTKAGYASKRKDAQFVQFKISRKGANLVSKIENTVK